MFTLNNTKKLYTEKIFLVNAILCNGNLAVKLGRSFYLLPRSFQREGGACVLFAYFCIIMGGSFECPACQKKCQKFDFKLFTRVVEYKFFREKVQEKLNLLSVFVNNTGIIRRRIVLWENHFLATS